MPKNPLVEKMAVSVSVGAVIIVALIGAMGWFFEKVPTRGDIESNEAMSLRISAWMKEELNKVDTRQVASETRVMVLENRHYDELIHRFDVMEGVQRDILSRLPGRVAGK